MRSYSIEFTVMQENALMVSLKARNTQIDVEMFCKMLYCIIDMANIAYEHYDAELNPDCENQIQQDDCDCINFYFKCEFDSEEVMIAYQTDMFDSFL